ncbi:collectin-11 [Elysia marginata]|uniref:Collectin-11 n=1 Tax=Elysia marginata TaxID=1093978 RepID=A0AAV4J0S1_9GAST|nr:collectin-11 [Elysia marginata]
MIVNHFLSPALSQISSCPSDVVANFDSDNLKTYKNKFCYMLVGNQELDYKDAETFCANNGGGTLFMPRTATQNSLILNLMDDAGVDRPAWIGISDRETEGDFVYADGSELELNAFNVFVNPIFAYVQDCVALDPSTGLWNKYRCANTFLSNARRPFVCQYSI